MNDVVFLPMISMSTMIILAVIMLFIVIINRKHLINRILIIAVLVIISQRPMLRDKDEIVFNMDLDVMFVIDNTVSMNAVDVDSGTRLDAVKSDCKKIMESFTGANFAIITYANIAQVKYPFTNDFAVISDIIDNLKIVDPNYATGSSLNLPYNYMKMLLESSSSKDKHKRIVFFMGDGELTKKEASNTDFSTYSDLADLINGGAVLGYGTIEGSKVIITESTALRILVDSEGYLKDGKTNQPAISKFNEDNLRNLASNLNLNYFHMTNYSVLASQISEIKDKAVKQEDDEKQKMDKDIYYYFTGALIVLLLLELYYCRRNEQWK